jgi:AcrR family transcriptional regulator
MLSSHALRKPATFHWRKPLLCTQSRCFPLELPPGGAGIGFIGILRAASCLLCTAQFGGFRSEVSMKRPDSYHHGNLRQALLEAARGLINEAGVEKLTLREVARRAGVTTGAPYHHFADKAELVYALTGQSLEELDQASLAALEGIVEPREQLRAIGVAYVLYAVDHPAEFRLMFRPEMGAPLDFADPETAPVFRILLRVVRACREAAGIQGTDGLDAAAISAWSLVHGLASLLVDGPLYTIRPDRERVHALAVSITNRVDVA